MSEDTSKALLDELRQFKADVEARRKRRRIVLWVIASPFIAFRRLLRCVRYFRGN